MFDIPSSSRVYGFDISHWSGVVDFQKAKASGASFVLIKATNGINISNYFRENWKGADGILPRGAYHWLYPSSVASVKAQAQKLYGLLLEVGQGEIPPIVDFETTWVNYKIQNPSASELWGFLIEYERISGIKPMIYTGPSFWQVNGNTSTAWTAYPLWIANYGRTTPIVPLPWTKYTFWQFSENGNGEDFGVDKYSERAIDLNYFGGTKQEFETLFGKTETEGEAMPTYISGTGMSLREDNPEHIQGAKVASLEAGKAATGDKIHEYKQDVGLCLVGDKWFHVTSANGQVVDLWVAVIHRGVTYGTVTGIPVVEYLPVDPPATAVTFPDEIIARIGTETKNYVPRT